MGSQRNQEAYCVAVGTSQTNYPWIDTRDPLPVDIYYTIGKFWINTALKRVWYLNSQSNISGSLLSDWELVFANSLLEELQGNDGVPVAPSGQIIQTLGKIVANSAFASPLFVASGGTNIENFNLQVAAAIASTNINKAGIASFNSSQFNVDANGFVSITNFSSFNYVNVNISNSPYTVTPTDEYISCDPSGGVLSILLPNAPTTFREFTIKDRTGFASSNHISVTTVGGPVTIDGETTYTIAGNHGAINLLFNGTSYEVF